MSMRGLESKLHKTFILTLYSQVHGNSCFYCKEPMTWDTISIEHKSHWRIADDPEAAFLDPNNIALSHRGCNARGGRKTTGFRRLGPKLSPKPGMCARGLHKMEGDNLYLRKDGKGGNCCRACKRAYDKTVGKERYAKRSPEEIAKRQEYQKRYWKTYKRPTKT